MTGNNIDKKKVLVSGATGFIGSHIVRSLLAHGYDVYAIYRATSSFSRCLDIYEDINWINLNKSNWKEKIIRTEPDIYIHSAWNGIESENRKNWIVQIRNFHFSMEVYDLVRKSGVKKIIAFGSQAEYGAQAYPVDESTVLNPDEAYGAIKTLCLNYLRNLCAGNNIEWYWIRVFSIFGEGDRSNGLIPTVILKLLKHEPIQLTDCTQQYNYLYIKEFSEQIINIVKCGENNSGIYNICDSKSVVLKDLLVQIAKILHVSTRLLQFGTIPQRKGQNMIITGDNSKYLNTYMIKDSSFACLTEGLIKTIESYQ
ncbi:MAG: NAD(P)-dependent oxidoreductase [Bacteroidetes bacterium]|nr:NAD(P)-dependent oxidoreductase [Bacteroidota bacterium]